MHYPFEKVPGYSGEFVNPKDKESFYLLKSLVHTGDEVAIKEWFERNNSILKVKGKENLAKAIGNHPYYFSIQNSGHITKEQIEEKENLLYKMLLKNFKLEHQFLILTQLFHFESEDLFTLLYQTAKIEKKEEEFFKSRIVLDPLMKMFGKEKFNQLQKIETIIGRKIVDIENNKMAFFYNNGASYYGNLNNSYKITDEIILNYSDNKRDFIISQGKEPPLKEYALKLLEDISNHYKKRDWLSKADEETMGNLSKNIDKYVKAVLYFELNEKYPEKAIKSKNKKI